MTPGPGGPWPGLPVGPRAARAARAGGSPEPRAGEGVTLDSDGRDSLSCAGQARVARVQ